MNGYGPKGLQPTLVAAIREAMVQYKHIAALDEKYPTTRRVAGLFLADDIQLILAQADMWADPEFAAEFAATMAGRAT